MSLFTNKLVKIISHVVNISVLFVFDYERKRLARIHIVSTICTVRPCHCDREKRKTSLLEHCIAQRNKIHQSRRLQRLHKTFQKILSALFCKGRDPV